MRFNRILLISPAYSKSVFSIPFLPTGIGYLAKALLEAGIEYYVLDMALGYKNKDVLSVIKKKQIDLVGVSMISYMPNDIYGLITEIKRTFTNIKVVVGGPHISSIRQKAFSECPDVDFGVVQEGESTLIELCKGYDPESIPGLIFRDDRQVKFTKERAFVKDLDSIPFPTYEGFELRRYGYGIGIVGTRGCPFQCIYCSCHVIGKTIRFRSGANVADEIEYWYRKGYREFGIQEDNPTVKKQRMIDLCDEIKKRRITDIRIMCGNGIRADQTDKDLLIRMREAGFKRLAFGVESASNTVLKSLKKGTTIEKIEETIRDACDLGFFVRLFFLVGSPGEKVRDVEKSIKFALSLNISDVSFFNLVPMPGSELFRWIDQNDYFLIPPEVYLNQDPHPARTSDPLFYTPEFSADERRMMLKKTQQVSKLVRAKRIEKRFSFLGVIGKIISRIYASNLINKIEHRLLSIELTRRILGPIRMFIRNKFYE